MTTTITRSRGRSIDSRAKSESYIKMGSPWYGPNEAQFLSRDTVFGQLKTPISLNRYTYAHGDPLSYFDPDGREACKVNDIFCGLRSIFGGKKSSKKSPISWSFRV